MKHILVMRRDDGAVRVGDSSDPEYRLSVIEKETGMPVRIAFQYPMQADARKIKELAQKILAQKGHAGDWLRISVEEAIGAVEQAMAMEHGLGRDVAGRCREGFVTEVGIGDPFIKTPAWRLPSLGGRGNAGH